MIIIAMDRASVRRLDAQGFLHIEASPISKAQIRTYYGQEIPGWEQLGLDASRPYRMYCSAEELQKAAPTFNNLPLLSEHIPVSADSIPDDLIAGSTGSHATFDGTYLNNSLSVWRRASIDGVQTNMKRELSSAYSYTALMQPGVYAGSNYDGRMVELKGNHVALVFEGRAGPDVVVGDENMLKSRAALMVQGALAAYLPPKLASGQAVDITVAMDGANAATFKDATKVKAFADAVVGLTDGKLANDAALDADGIVTLIGTLSMDEANDEIAEPAAASNAGGAVTITDKDGKPVIVTPAMDAAAIQTSIDAGVSAATAAIEARFEARRTAERETFDVIGDVACDSAEATYKMALDQMGVKIGETKPSEYGALFRALHANNAAKPIAQDRAMMNGSSKLAGIVPDLAPMGVI